MYAKTYCYQMQRTLHLFPMSTYTSSLALASMLQQMLRPIFRNSQLEDLFRPHCSQIIFLNFLVLYLTDLFYFFNMSSSDTVPQPEPSVTERDELTKRVLPLMILGDNNSLKPADLPLPTATAA